MRGRNGSFVASMYFGQSHLTHFIFLIDLFNLDLYTFFLLSDDRKTSLPRLIVWGNKFPQQIFWHRNNSPFFYLASVSFDDQNKPGRFKVFKTTVRYCLLPKCNSLVWLDKNHVSVPILITLIIVSSFMQF